MLQQSQQASPFHNIGDYQTTSSSNHLENPPIQSKPILQDTATNLIASGEDAAHKNRHVVDILPQATTESSFMPEDSIPTLTYSGISQRQGIASLETLGKSTTTSDNTTSPSTITTNLQSIAVESATATIEFRNHPSTPASLQHSLSAVSNSDLSSPAKVETAQLILESSLASTQDLIFSSARDQEDIIATASVDEASYAALNIESHRLVLEAGKLSRDCSNLLANLVTTAVADAESQQTDDSEYAQSYSTSELTRSTIVHQIDTSLETEHPAKAVAKMSGAQTPKPAEGNGDVPVLDSPVYQKPTPSRTTRASLRAITPKATAPATPRRATQTPRSASAKVATTTPLKDRTPVLMSTTTKRRRQRISTVIDEQTHADASALVLQESPSRDTTPPSKRQKILSTSQQSNSASVAAISRDVRSAHEPTSGQNVVNRIKHHENAMKKFETDLSRLTDQNGWDARWIKSQLRTTKERLRKILSNGGSKESQGSAPKTIFQGDFEISADEDEDEHRMQSAMIEQQLKGMFEEWPAPPRLTASEKIDEARGQTTSASRKQQKKKKPFDRHRAAAKADAGLSGSEDEEGGILKNADQRLPAVSKPKLDEELMRSPFYRDALAMHGGAKFEVPVEELERLAAVSRCLTCTFSILI